MAHDIFISYSSIDANIANAVCHNLEQGGIRCWMAPRDIPPGGTWAEIIPNAIQEAKVFVLIFSDNIDNGFAYSLAMALYVPVCVPYAPGLLLLLGNNNNKILPMIIVLMHLVFLGISIIVSLIYQKQKKTCADQRR